MNYKPYPENFWTQIQTQLNALKEKNLNHPQNKLIAAFDADGTLWDVDAGENFFQYQIDHKLVELPSNPFDYYYDLKKINNNPENAFLWLAQINKGQNEATVKNWGEKAFKTIQPNPIFSEQKKLIDLLHQNSVEVFVVTASVKWAIEYGASLFGIDANHVIGVETVVKNQIITDEAILPITYKKGKADALLKKTNGQRPFLASGNTMGDYELLECATELRLAVSAASADDSIYRTEIELQQNAKNNNWLSHRFI